ncbi:MAG: phage portal protein [Nitrospirales bacterium]|nr:MAG: phage portal protein [Nitrospirales bacterium]
MNLADLKSLIFGVNNKKVSGIPASKLPKIREFQAGKIDNLTSSWRADPQPINALLQRALRPMVARSRDAAQNNPYGRKFVNMVAGNVVGPNGLRLQSQLKFASGNLRKKANKIIEDRWEDFSKNVNTAQNLSWNRFCSLASKTIAIDGECVIRIVHGFPNTYGIAFQIIDSTRLDVDRNESLPGGGKIVMGVELDVWERPVAYHITDPSRSNASYLHSLSGKTTRIPASEIIHVFLQEFPEQVRGIPWMASALWEMNMIHSYEEAEVVAARIGASKMGFFTTENGGMVPVDSSEGGELLLDAEPGQFRGLPPGVKLMSWDPNHPNSNYDQFMKRALRGMSSGLLVAYNNISTDLEGVNFSSIRQGVLDERDMFRMMQADFISQVCLRSVESWFTMGVINGSIPIGAEHIEEVVSHLKFQSRGWPWVDPLKDFKTNEGMVRERFRSRRMILAEQGIDFEEVLEQLKEEEAMLKQAGLLSDQNILNQSSVGVENE